MGNNTFDISLVHTEAAPPHPFLQCLRCYLPVCSTLRMVEHDTTSECTFGSGKCAIIIEASPMPLLGIVMLKPVWEVEFMALFMCGSLFAWRWLVRGKCQIDEDRCQGVFVAANENQVLMNLWTSTLLGCDRKNAHTVTWNTCSTTIHYYFTK